MKEMTIIKPSHVLMSKKHIRLFFRGEHLCVEVMTFLEKLQINRTIDACNKTYCANYETSSDKSASGHLQNFICTVFNILVLLTTWFFSPVFLQTSSLGLICLWKQHLISWDSSVLSQHLSLQSLAKLCWFVILFVIQFVYLLSYPLFIVILLRILHKDWWMQVLQLRNLCISWLLIH